MDSVRPGINHDHHFCNLECLRVWLATPPEERPQADGLSPADMFNAETRELADKFLGKVKSDAATAIPLMVISEDN
jgi:hypothetical protein